jgi:hypothetical protein
MCLAGSIFELAVLWCVSEESITSIFRVKPTPKTFDILAAIRTSNLRKTQQFEYKILT